MPSMTDFPDLDLTGQAALLAKGDVTPLELLDAAIDRIEAGEPTLNAVITRRFEAAREAAQHMPQDTPLGGVPFMHKDLVDVAGFPRSEGGHAALHQHPAADPPLIANLRQAGAIFLASTNTPEFASLPVTANTNFGVTRNPWDTSKTAAGSSGGSAVAVAAAVPLSPYSPRSSGASDTPSTPSSGVGAPARSLSVR